MPGTWNGTAAGMDSSLRINGHFAAVGKDYTGCSNSSKSTSISYHTGSNCRRCIISCGADMTENAILTAVRDGRTERLLTVRACRGGLMSLDVMTLTGMALMSVTYDGTMLVSTNYVPLPKELRAEQIVADILMGTLPAEAWTTLPSGYHLRIEEKSRTLVDGDGAEIERFTYADGPRGARLASLRHEAFGYSIGFRYLEDPAVPDSTTDKPGPNEEKAQ